MVNLGDILRLANNPTNIKILGIISILSIIQFVGKRGGRGGCGESIKNIFFSQKHLGRWLL